MLNWSDSASSIKYFTKDGDLSSPFLRDVEELWELEMGASQNISVVSCCACSRVSLLFTMYFVFQQKSLKIGLYAKFYNSPVLQQSNERVLRTEYVLMCHDRALEGHSSSLGEEHIGQEGSGKGSPGLCLLFLPYGRGNFNLLCQQKRVNDFFWSFRQTDLWLAERILTVLLTGLHLHLAAVHQVTDKVIQEYKPFEEAVWGDFLQWCVAI